MSTAANVGMILWDNSGIWGTVSGVKIQDDPSATLCEGAAIRLTGKFEKRAIIFGEHWELFLRPMHYQK
jgi:hypothetical protein